MGAIWNPLAPAPIRANLEPLMSRPSSQRVEWNDGPSNSAIPGMSGMRGRFRDPTALITKRASSVSVVPSPADVSTLQRALESSQVMDVTVTPNRQFGSSPYFSTTAAK